MNIRLFTESDWSAYNGAEGFGEGDENPVITLITLKDSEMEIIADKNGIEANEYRNGEAFGVWNLKMEIWSSEIAKAVIHHLCEGKSKFPIHAWQWVGLMSLKANREFSKIQ